METHSVKGEWSFFMNIMRASNALHQILYDYGMEGRDTILPLINLYPHTRSPPPWQPCTLGNHAVESHIVGGYQCRKCVWPVMVMIELSIQMCITMVIVTAKDIQELSACIYNIIISINKEKQTNYGHVHVAIILNLPCVLGCLLHWCGHHIMFQPTVIITPHACAGVK